MRARHKGSARRDRTPLPSTPVGIGTLLRATREEIGTSLLTVNTATGVTLGCLEAIETGHVLGYGDQVMILAGLRRYATYLGLDGDALALAMLDVWPAAAPVTGGLTRDGQVGPHMPGSGALHGGPAVAAAPQRDPDATWMTGAVAGPLMPNVAPARPASPIEAAAHHGGGSAALEAPLAPAMASPWFSSDAPTGVHDILTMTSQVPIVSGPGDPRRAQRDGAPPVYRKRRRIPLALRFALFLTVALLAVGGAGLAVDRWHPQWLQDLHIVRSHVASPGSAITTTTTVPHFHSLTSSPSGATYAVPARRFAVNIGISQPTWIQVTTSSSSAPVYTGVLQPQGQIQTFRANGDISVVIGAGGTVVSVSVNGKAIAMLKPPSAPYTLTFTYRN